MLWKRPRAEMTDDDSFLRCAVYHGEGRPVGSGRRGARISAQRAATVYQMSLGGEVPTAQVAPPRTYPYVPTGDDVDPGPWAQLFQEFPEIGLGVHTRTDGTKVVRKADSGAELEPYEWSEHIADVLTKEQGKLDDDLLSAFGLKDGFVAYLTADPHPPHVEETVTLANTVLQMALGPRSGLPSGPQRLIGLTETEAHNSIFAQRHRLRKFAKQTGNRPHEVAINWLIKYVLNKYPPSTSQKTKRK